MRLGKFIERWENLLAENRYLRFTCAVLALALVVESIVVVRQAGRVRTVLVPPKVEREVWLEAGEVSTAYLQMMGGYVAELASSYSPKNARSRFGLLLYYVDPAHYAEVKASLDATAAQVERLGVAQAFFPQGAEVDAAKNEVTVTGLIQRTVEGQVVESGPRNVSVTYDISNGRFEVESIQIKSDARR
ncbi:MAG: type IV conjugative transfer system protein TraE [Pseudomonadota bacterium]